MSSPNKATRRPPLCLQALNYSSQEAPILKEIYLRRGVAEMNLRNWQAHLHKLIWSSTMVYSPLHSWVVTNYSNAASRTAVSPGKSWDVVTFCLNSFRQNVTTSACMHAWPLLGNIYADLQTVLAICRQSAVSLLSVLFCAPCSKRWWHQFIRGSKACFTCWDTAMRNALASGDTPLSRNVCFTCSVFYV